MEPKPNRSTRAVGRLARTVFWAYAAVAAVLFPIGVAVFAMVASTSTSGGSQMAFSDVVTAYGYYMMDESPRRGGAFASLAVTLGAHAEKHDTSEGMALKILGKPDKRNDDAGDGSTLEYRLEPTPASPQAAILIVIRDDLVRLVGYAPQTDN